MIVFFTTIDVVAPDIYHYIQYHLFGFPNGRGKNKKEKRGRKLGVSMVTLGCGKAGKRHVSSPSASGLFNFIYRNTLAD